MKSYIIRLEESKHSCEIASECYSQARKMRLDVKYFKGINGLDAASHYEQTGLKPARKLKKNKPGVIGCFFSHYYLWKRCIEFNEPLVILEHDGYMLRPIPDNICDSFTDVLKLDNLNPYSKLYNDQIEQELNLPLTIQKYHNPLSKDLTTKIFKGTGNYFMGAYAYILKPSGATKLIDFVHTHGHVTADQQLGDLVLDTNVTIPSLARLHPFYCIDDRIKVTSLTKNLEDNI